MNAEIYQENIMERYRNPTNYGSVNNPHVISKDYNPSCGDVIEIQMKISNDTIQDIKFQGQGCAISKSSADMLLDLVKNKNLDYVKNLTKDDVIKILGIDLSPLRLKCALLPLKVLKTASYTYLGEKLQ